MDCCLRLLRQEAVGPILLVLVTTVDFYAHNSEARRIDGMCYVASSAGVIAQEIFTKKLTAKSV